MKLLLYSSRAKADRLSLMQQNWWSSDGKNKIISNYCFQWDLNWVKNINWHIPQEPDAPMS